jgi:hypothetical protein
MYPSLLVYVFLELRILALALFLFVPNFSRGQEPNRVVTVELKQVKLKVAYTLPTLYTVISQKESRIGKSEIGPWTVFPDSLGRITSRIGFKADHNKKSEEYFTATVEILYSLNGESIADVADSIYEFRKHKVHIFYNENIMKYSRKNNILVIKSNDGAYNYNIYEKFIKYENMIIWIKSNARSTYGHKEIINMAQTFQVNAL